MSVVSGLRFARSISALRSVGSTRQHCADDLVLNVEPVVEISIETICPKVGAVGRFDELARDPYAISRFPGAALKDIHNAKSVATFRMSTACPL